MRIVSGNLRGRLFDSSSKTTHPMSEKMRGAIFNALGDVEGLKFLDVFAGSGAISFEAISRGAKSSLAIESNRHAQSDIKKNIIELGLETKVKLISASYSAWSSTNSQVFDVIIADPPYNDLHLDQLATINLKLKAAGIFVLSLPPNSAPPAIEGLIQLSQKIYGDSTLVFYKNNL